jgi:phosphatidylglycerol:prolipoprotein diacylglycerol transferase
VVAFYLPGGIAIYTFSLILAVGTFIGLVWVTLQAPEDELSQRIDAGLWALFGGLISGRLLYVAINWSYFQLNIWESLQVHQGGIHFVGTFTGGLISLAVFSWIRGLHFGRLADSLVPLMAAVSVSIWLGCWIDGCGYGPSAPYWWGFPTADEWGTITRRWPLQPVAALSTVALLWLLERYAQRRRLKPGLLASLGFLGVSMILFITSFFRVDPTPICFNWRLETCISFLYILLALCGVIWFSQSKLNDHAERQSI